MKIPVSQRILWVTLIGSSIQWFDFLLYGTMSPLIFDQQFFPQLDPSIGTILSYASFSIPFFIRPLGGIMFGHFGDTVGRKKAWVLSLWVMGGSTALIGMLPTYHTIGGWASILLVLLRVGQGLSIGGGWGGAVLLAVESAPKEKEGFFGSIPQAGLTMGLLLSTLTVSLIHLLPPPLFQTWGWRIPFLLSAILVFIGIWIYNTLEDTQDFQSLQASEANHRFPFWHILLHDKTTLLRAIGLNIVETAPFFIFVTFILLYGTQILGLSENHVLNAVTFSNLITIMMIPWIGYLSDRFGLKKIYIVGTIAIGLFSFPYFYLLSFATWPTLFIATGIGLGILWPMVTSVLGTLYSKMFSPSVRYTGITLSDQLGAALAGGTAPFISTFLIQVNHRSWVPLAIYIVCTSLISLAAILFTPIPQTEKEKP